MGSPDKSGGRDSKKKAPFPANVCGEGHKKAVSLLYAELDTAFIQIFQDDYHSNCEFIFFREKKESSHERGEIIPDGE